MEYVKHFSNFPMIHEACYILKSINTHQYAKLKYCFSQTRMVKRADKLKEDVAKIVASSDNCSLLQRLNLIHVLERLCLDHLFEQEINGVLTQVSNVDISGCDLHTVALWFYLLRSHGYKVSPGRIYSIHSNLCTLWYLRDIIGLMHLW